MTRHVTETVDDVVQSNITEYWSRRADAYDAHHVRQLRHDAVREAWVRIWRAALPQPPARILDVGTGTGHVSVLLAELGYDVVGIDLAERMLERARQKAAHLVAPPSLQLGDAVRPEFPSGSFDAVTSRYVLWTLRTPDVALANWKALLRPGGLLAVVDSTWFPDGVHGGDSADSAGVRPEFQSRYDERVLAALPLAESRTTDDMVRYVREAGFVDVVRTPLTEVYELDRRFGVAEGHELRRQYVIIGRA